jgi:hypothetical protein
MRLPIWQIFVVALCACEGRPSEQKAVARDLSRALAPPSAEAADTAAQRKRDELEKCKYMYRDEQGLRECLVVKNGWETQDAAREIAIYKAQIARTVDSLQHLRGSILSVEMRRQEAARQREETKRRQQAAYAAMQPYWGIRLLEDLLHEHTKLRRPAYVPVGAAPVFQNSGGS